MSKKDKNAGQWKAGMSGNPKGRPRKGEALTELLRLQGEEMTLVGKERVTSKEALARAVWKFALTGQTRLGDREIIAKGAGEWAQVVKWLYAQVEPPSFVEPEREMVVRVVRGRD
jgi:hypothetical protein